MGALLSEFLRPLETAIIPATDGTECIGKATDVFTGHIVPDFENWGLNVPSEARGEQPAQVYELVKKGRFDQFFPTFTEERELDRLCLTQSQIVSFCRNNRHLLRQDGFATFFLFKKGDEYFVAVVGVRSSGELDVGVGRFSRDRVWSSDGSNRVVIPQLEN